VEKAQDKD